MRTLIQAWKLRIAHKAFARAAEDKARLHAEYCAPFAGDLSGNRPSLVILADMVNADTRMRRAERTIYALDAR